MTDVSSEGNLDIKEEVEKDILSACISGQITSPVSVDISVKEDTTAISSNELDIQDEVNTGETTLKTEPTVAMVTVESCSEENGANMSEGVVTKLESDQNEDTTAVKVENGVSGCMAYRGDSDSEDEVDSSEDSSSSSSSSSDSEDDVRRQCPQPSDGDDDDDERPGRKKKGFLGIRTKGELYPEELPPLEELTISVDETVEMQEVGRVTSVVGVLVVIQASKNMPVLDEDTVLFTEKREAIGKIFEVFGPVVSPFYSVRFNSPEDIVQKNIESGQALYCAPKEQEYTQFVFVERLKRIKGSDASWENNHEPPNWCVEYSDDEDEKRTKSKNRNKPPIEGSTDNPVGNKKPRNAKRRPQDRQRGQNENGTHPEGHSGGRGGSKSRGGRGAIQSWPPRQETWPPRDSSSWPPRPTDSWSASPQPSHFSPRGHPRPFLSPSSFRGGRGGMRPPSSGHQGYPQGQMSHQGQGHQDYPGSMNGQGPRYPHGNLSHDSQGMNQFQGPLMDTRLMQNTESGPPPFSPNMNMASNPRMSTFGGLPQFPSGIRHSRGPRPGYHYGSRFSGPPGHW